MKKRRLKRSKRAGSLRRVVGQQQVRTNGGIGFWPGWWGGFLGSFVVTPVVPLIAGPVVYHNSEQNWNKNFGNGLFWGGIWSGIAVVGTVAALMAAFGLTAASLFNATRQQQQDAMRRFESRSQQPLPLESPFEMPFAQQMQPGF